MHNLLRYYRQNRKQIWIILLFVILIFLGLQGLERMTIKSKEKEKFYMTNSGSNSSINNTTITQREKNPVVSGTGVSERKVEENKNVINTFIEYCNNKDVQSAYDILTEECKEKMFPTIQDFINNYYTKVFAEVKIPDVQVWITNDTWYTYKIILKGDILATGKVEQSKNSYTDYYTIVTTKDGEQRLNINKYVGRDMLEKETVNSNLSIKLISKDVYIDYEIYNMEIRNNTQNTILMDSKRNTDTLYLLGSNEVKYSALLHEIDDSFITLEGNMSRNISIKFNKVYNPSRIIDTMHFTDIILNYEEYLSNTKEYNKAKTMVIGM